MGHNPKPLAGLRHYPVIAISLSRYICDTDKCAVAAAGSPCYAIELHSIGSDDWPELLLVRFHFGLPGDGLVQRRVWKAAVIRRVCNCVCFNATYDCSVRLVCFRFQPSRSNSRCSVARTFRLYRLQDSSRGRSVGSNKVKHPYSLPVTRLT